MQTCEIVKVASFVGKNIWWSGYFNVNSSKTDNVHVEKKITLKT